MSGPDYGALPARAAACRVTVVIPARDEAATIARTLAALAAQRGSDGRPLPPDLFEVIVFANRCSDDTAAAARRAAARTPHVPVFVIEDSGTSVRTHVGSARRYVMDLAAARYCATGATAGIIASLDADTIPSREWIDWIVREMRGRDAVAGHVTIAEADQERLLAPVRLLYARELAYRRIFAELESVIDPRPEDPYPRHGSFVGASFAVSAACYVAAGRLPALPRLEDLEFSRALQRIDARVRHSPFVRATTSDRVAARVDGGFGTFIAELHACARRGDSFGVEHPLRTLEVIESRAALRRLWNGDARCDDIARAAEILALPAEQWLPTVDRAVPFGAVYERIARRARNVQRRYPQARVELAIETLRAAVVHANARQISAFVDAEAEKLGAG